MTEGLIQNEKEVDANNNDTPEFGGKEEATKVKPPLSRLGDDTCCHEPKSAIKNDRMLGKRNPQNNPPQAGKPEESDNALVSGRESVTSKEVD